MVWRDVGMRGAIGMLILAMLSFVACSAETNAPVPSPEEAQAAMTDVMARVEAGDLDGALQRYPEAVRGHQLAFEEAPLVHAQALEELALAFFLGSEGRGAAWQAAAELLEEAVRIREDAPNGDPLDLALTLSDLASVEYERGRWQSGEDFDRRSLAIRREAQGADHPEVLWSEVYLAQGLLQQGRLDEAETLLTSALAHLEPGAAEDEELEELEAQTSNALGELSRLQGRTDSAQRFFERAVAAARMLGPESPLLADSLNNLALLLQDQGRYRRADRLLREALRVARSNQEEEPHNLIRALLNQAELLRLQNRWVEAEKLYLEALAEARPLMVPENGHVDPQWMYFLSSLARFYDDQGSHEEAAPYHREALEVAGQTTETNPQILLPLAHDSAVSACGRGDFKGGKALLRRAIEERRTTLGESHPWVAASWIELARCLHREGREPPSRSLEALDRALAVLGDEEGHHLAERIEAQALRARVLRRAGRSREAVAVMDQALDRIEGWRTETVVEDRARAQSWGRYLEEFYTQAAWLVEDGHAARALTVAERGRARVLLEQLRASRIDLRQGIPAITRERLEAREDQARETLAAARRDLDQQLREGDTEDLDEAEAAVQRATRDLRRLTQEIDSTSPLWEQLAEPVGGAEAQRRVVPENGYAVVYFVGSEGSVAFAVPPAPAAMRAFPLRVSEEMARDLAIQAGPLTSRNLAAILGLGKTDGVLTSWRSTRGPHVPGFGAADDPETLNRLHTLWRLLVPEPLWREISSLESVIVVPDGPLYQLPFEALVEAVESEEEATYWLDSGPRVRYAASLSSLAVLQKGSASGNGETISQHGLLVADPIFSHVEDGDEERPAIEGVFADGLDLNRLRGTEREAAGILEAFAGSETLRWTSLLREQATEKKIRSHLAADPRFIHFATHGLVDSRGNELQAALVLTASPTGVQGSTDDGFLQLFEIYEMRLSGDLAVLSACETRSGPTVPGEGVFALSRGFLTAGLPRVVATLWAVNDQSTGELMTRFYQEIADFEARGETVDYGAALRIAQQSLRRHPDHPEWHAPRHWAPFVLVGAP